MIYAISLARQHLVAETMADNDAPYVEPLIVEVGGGGYRFDW
jgi:hypothetical protein